MAKKKNTKIDVGMIPRTIVLIPTGELRAHARNAKAHSPNQIEALGRSIQKFGFIVPILINSKSEIIAGHGRFEAAQVMGLEEVPCIQIDHLTPAEETAYRIADNRLAEIGTSWSDKLLGQEFASLKDADFDMELTGFSMDEIDEFMPDLEAAADEILAHDRESDEGENEEEETKQPDRETGPPREPEAEEETEEIERAVCSHCGQRLPA